MRDRGNKRPFLRTNLEYLHHEWNVVSLFKPVRYRVLKNRRRKGAKRFAPLDLGIEDSLHVGAARISHDRAIPERSGTPFHTPLEPSYNLAIGDRCGGSPTQVTLVRHDL